MILRRGGGNIAQDVDGASLLSTAGRSVTYAGKKSESWNILASKGYIPVFLYPAMMFSGMTALLTIALAASSPMP